MLSRNSVHAGVTVAATPSGFSTNRLHRRNDNTHNNFWHQEQVVRCACEAEALPEEVNPESSFLEAEVEDPCGRGYCAWQKQNAPEVLNIKTGFAQVV